MVRSERRRGGEKTRVRSGERRRARRGLRSSSTGRDSGDASRWIAGDPARRPRAAGGPCVHVRDFGVTRLGMCASSSTFPVEPVVAASRGLGHSEDPSDALAIYSCRLSVVRFCESWHHFSIIVSGRRYQGRSARD